MKNNHKPEIRFPGVTGDWGLCKLKDISKIYDGTHQTPKYKDSGVKFVSVEDINDIEASNKYISTEDYETQFKNKPEVGDIFMTRITAGVIGATAVIESDNPIAYYVSLALIKPSKKILSLFLSSYISTKEFKKELNKRIIHTAFPKKINLADIGECIVSRPIKEEQAKIGVFFKMLDDTIALHQQELTTLKQTKQGFLQKMFPKEGESVPEVRFPGFTGDWEQRRLGEMLKERNEQIPENEEYPLMSFVQGTGVTPKGDRYDRSFLVKDDNKKYKKTELGDFIYSSNNLETGSIGFNKTGKAVISPVYSIFSSKNKLESQFIGILSTRKDFIWKMVRFRQGVVYGQWRIHEKDFLDIQISVPSHNEQEEIIGFFANLDNLITLHQRELEVLKETKKAFLQKMFV
ncbi:restriction endonuclease subunit S [Bacillus cereus]|nr:restriction endonuclease subunit S [Bacillus cereus]